MTQRMMYRRRIRAIVAVTAVALVATACEGGRGKEKGTGKVSVGPGTTIAGAPATIVDTSNCPADATAAINGDTIKFGVSIPQSGLYAAFNGILSGATAYVEYVNKELGGVEIAGKKYKIELVAKDDAYEAQKTVNNVNQLVADDGVFGLFSVVGTKNNLAIRQTLDEQCIPDLFAATGAATWGNPKYPWLLGTPLVPYPLEMKALVDYLQKQKPDAKVAILRASDDFGKTYSDVFNSLIKDTKLKVVAEATYNPEQFDTKSQITSLASSKADVLILGATLLACPDALKNVKTSGWEPIVYMSGTCTSKTIIGLAGPAADKVISVAPFMDPADPQWKSNEQMALFKTKVPVYAKEADVNSGVIAFGWTAGAMLVETLKQSPQLTRAAVMEAARNLTGLKDIGLMNPGAVFNVNAEDRFLGETFNMMQYSLAKGYFEILEGPINFDGKTASLTPESLLNS